MAQLFASWLALVFLFLAAPITARADGDPSRPHSIASISVCSPAATGASISCPDGTGDTAQPVLAPDGQLINSYGGLAALADEHASIFPPGTIPGHPDYLFWVATQTSLNQGVSGLVVLTGGSGPNANGQWTLDYAHDFGLYVPDNPPGQQNGQIFLAPTLHLGCPTVSDGKPEHQDPTFDLNYADPGSVILDPTNRANKGPGSLLMVYEGTNRCIGSAGGKNDGNNFYSTLAVATSFDYGVNWPSYRSDWVQLPGQNSSSGPEAPLGALGDQVCVGNDCNAVPPENYGRYAVLSPPVTVGDAMEALGNAGLSSNMGDSEPSAFVDDVNSGGRQDPDHSDTGRDRYLYVVDTYNPGPAILGVPRLPNGSNDDLVVARARFNGGSTSLEFMKWYSGSFAEPGLGSAGGGLSDPIFSVADPGLFESCEAPGQARSAGSISYVEETQQYLLVFVCRSPSDPRTQTGNLGAAWFYSTIDARRYDLSHQEQWSKPQEIVGSWSEFRSTDGCNDAFKGWYPSLMSLDRKPGHLSTTGYVFFLDGCLSSVPDRKFSTRAFTITTK